MSKYPNLVWDQKYFKHSAGGCDKRRYPDSCCHCGGHMFRCEVTDVGNHKICKDCIQLEPDERHIYQQSLS